jgi:urea transporter
VRAVLEGILRPYAQIILSRSLVSGALIVAAIATFPSVAFATLVALTVAQALVLALGFGRTVARDGIVGCAAVLTTLAVAMTNGSTPWPLLVTGAVLAVFVTTALQLVLAQYGLPPLSLPFVAAAWIVLLLPHASATGFAQPLALLPASWLAPSLWDVPAAILYVHGALAGGLLLAAIAWHSRIGLFLAGLGAAAAAAVHAILRPGVDVGPADVTAAFNALLTAMVVGGVFFVPHPTSLLLALLSGALASVLSYALLPWSGALSVPLLSLPFALTTMLVIAALRLRERDRLPATALLSATNPEDALERHLMRVRRFGDSAWLPFRLPFRGSWTVTQGHEGAHTHRGLWRHALDFEILGADGLAYQTDGRDPRDFRCYNLPVLAAGTGTIDHARDDIPDNPIGGMNARDNWGNTVVIAHGSNLYSVYAHLRPGSIAVKAGDAVRAGATIGRCGNSGRSLVPHLHFHVQRGAALGSETLAADFGDVVQRHGQHVTVAHRVIPVEGAIVRPIIRDESLASALAFWPGTQWRLHEPATGRTEEARVEVDLWGRSVLRSPLGALYLESYDNALVAVACDGNSQSLLRYVVLTLARVPFDQDGAVEWTDRVPRRLVGSWPWGVSDLFTVLAPGMNDWEITYRARRTEGTFVIEGSAPAFRSTAVIALSGSAHQLTLERDGRSRTVVLTRVDHDSGSQEP